MCGNIKKLRFEGRCATDEELMKAAQQFIKKVSNYSKPSATNRDVYEQALQQVTSSLRDLLVNIANVK